jgi:GAF domain-containing protein
MLVFAKYINAADVRRSKADLQRENAELHRRLDERTAERDEALQRETATAEVLGLINSSPGDLGPVWDAMLERATRLCEAASGILWTYDGTQFYPAALHGVSAEATDQLRKRAGPRPSKSLAAIAQGELVARDDDFTLNERPNWAFDTAGMRTGFIVAMRKGDELLGAIRIFRREAHPFTDKQIALLENFAAQAVIAIENARLLTETREALEQQTATAEVLGVINSSPGDTKPVFDAILEKAHALCGAEYGVLLTYNGERFRPAAIHGTSLASPQTMREGIRPGFAFGRLLRGERFIHIHDMAEVAAEMPDDPLPRALFEVSGIRTQLAVPLRKDDKFLGIITANRREVRPFFGEANCADRELCRPGSHCNGERAPAGRTA